MSVRQYQKELELLFDAAGRILEATNNDQQTTQNLIKELRALRTVLERDIRTLSANTISTIERSAETTAHRAAELLAEKFAAADNAAEMAAYRYEQAAKQFNWRFLGASLIFTSVLFAGALTLVLQYLSSKSAIDQRRNELVFLEDRLAQLEKQGIRAQFRQCSDSEGRIYLCVQTDEEVIETAFSDGKKTYRIVAQP